MIEKTITMGQYADMAQKSQGGTQNNQASGLQFSDMVDVINPLHHIPLVSHLYRGVTGDQIGPVARFAGGGLYGGPLGAGGALVSIVTENELSGGNDDIQAYDAYQNAGRSYGSYASDPETSLSRAVQFSAEPSLPESTLGFQEFSAPSVTLPSNVQHVEIEGFVPDLYHRRSIY